ncbi:MAG: PQQ-binding-like beta-propeller repeat protein [Planctomycetota bacterium]
MNDPNDTDLRTTGALRPRLRRPAPAHPPRGVAFASPLVALVLALAAWAPAQQRQRTVPVPQEFVTTQDDSLFSLTRSQEDVHEWEQARRELADGAWPSAVERLHRLLQNELGGSAAVGPNRFVGLRHAVVLTMANLPPAAVTAYEELVRRQAGALQDRDPVTLRREQLEVLADRFPAAEVGRRARLRLGDLCLEQGDGIGASGHFAQALEAAPIGSQLEREVFERLRCAEALQRASALRSLQDRGRELDPVAASVLAVLPRAQDHTDWPAFGGGGDGSRPMATPAGRPQPFFQDHVQALGFDGAGGSFAMQPTGGLDAVYVHTGLEVLAFDPLRQDLLWSSLAPLRDQGDARSIRDYPGSINQNMVLGAAIGDDVVVAALQVPDESSLVRYQNAFTIVHRIPERRLFAFQRSTGKLLWSHFDRIEGPVTERYSGHSSCGPPLIVGDTVYAPVHDRSGAIAFYLGAYDLHTGKPHWRRLICSSQQEVNMFGNARMEFAASPLCTAEGMVLGASNLGVCYAVELGSGRLRWITAYDVIRMPPAQLQAQDTRTVYFQNSAPAIADGVLCCTPLDSEFVLGIDVLTGHQLWRVPHQAKAQGNNDVRWLCGAIDGEFVLAGAGVVAVPARPDVGPGGRAPVRLVRGPEFLGSDDRGEQPRPAVTDRTIWFPSSHGVSVFDIEGNLAPDSGELRLQAPGNLLLVDGILVSLGNRSFEVLLDQAALRARAEERLRETPNDPAAILRLCALRTALSGDDRADAELEALYRRGRDACVAQGLPRQHPLHARFLRRLFEQALSRASRGDDLAPLLAAREYAPDAAAFLRVQSMVIERVGRDREALLRELQLLEQRAAGERYDLPGADGEVQVSTYVAWRRTQLAADPGAQLLGWQELMQRHGDAALRGRKVADLARDAIAALLEAHGRSLYAPIEERAQRTLREAGESREALRAVGTTFPHSEAAAVAQRRLLDAAVRDGDLATAIDVFAQAVRAGAPGGATTRRLLEAARRRGNLALAQALAARLAADPTASDWPEDDGRPYREVAARLLQELGDESRGFAVARPHAVPAEILSELTSPTPPLPFNLLPTERTAGFRALPDVPLYVRVDNQVRAIDVFDPDRPTLFAHQGGLVDRLWVCGPVLVVSALEELSGLDPRAGTVQWRLGDKGSYLVTHGIADGLLLVSRRDGGSDVELLAVEPLTGRVLWRRSLPAAEHAGEPRLVERGLLVPHLPEGADPRVQRIDAVTGAEVAAFALDDRVRQAAEVPFDVLRTGLMLMLKQGDMHGDLLVLPIQGQLRSSRRPCILAVTAAGDVAWQWTGTERDRLEMVARRGDRLCVVEAGALDERRGPQTGRALLLAADTGAVLREVPLGPQVQVLNWRSSTAAPAPSALLLSDLDPRSNDRRLVYVPVDDLPQDQGAEPFALTIGGPAEEVLRSPWCGDGLLVYGVHSQKAQGPVRLFALRLGDRRGALPDERKYLLLPVPRRSDHEMGTAGPYTVLVTDARLYVLGDGKDIR